MTFCACIDLFADAKALLAHAETLVWHTIFANFMKCRAIRDPITGALLLRKIVMAAAVAVVSLPAMFVPPMAAGR